MHIEDHDPLGRLQEASRRYRNTRTWLRVQAILLAKQGDTAAHIARALGVSRRAVQAWVTAYNRGGLEALPDRQRVSVLLYYYAGFPLADVARLTNRPAGTVKSDLFQARALLRQALDGTR